MQRDDVVCLSSESPPTAASVSSLEGEGNEGFSWVSPLALLGLRDLGFWHYRFSQWRLRRMAKRGLLFC